MWSGLLVRFPTSDDNDRTAGPVRIESCPPSALPARPGWADRLMDWLSHGGYAAASRFARDEDDPAPAGVSPLATVRQEFIDCLGDVATRQASDLAERIVRARSLRELWHLRSEVFSLVSCHANQAEAKSRLARLNRHFPARAPRSGFGGFDAQPHANPHD
jgi:hypothetical protein